MPYCPACGQEIEPAWNACPNCGHELPEEPPVRKNTPPPKDAHPGGQNQADKQGTTRRRRLFIAGGIVTTSMFGGGLWWLLSEGLDSKTSDQNPPEPVPSTDNPSSTAERYDVSETATIEGYDITVGESLRTEKVVQVFEDRENYTVSPDGPPPKEWILVHLSMTNAGNEKSDVRQPITYKENIVIEYADQSTPPASGPLRMAVPGQDGTYSYFERTVFLDVGEKEEGWLRFWVKNSIDTDSISLVIYNYDGQRFVWDLA